METNEELRYHEDKNQRSVVTVASGVRDLPEKSHSARGDRIRIGAYGRHGTISMMRRMRRPLRPRAGALAGRVRGGIAVRRFPIAALAADRNLLFGLLALWNGLIDQGQLVAAFQERTLDKARALADHLVGRGDLDADDRSAVDAQVARHIKKHGGEVERSLAAIPAGCSTRDSLARIDDPEVGGSLAHLGSRSTQQDDDRTASYAVGTVTSDGQRFRLLRPHARGGLGAVYVALDSELHREVALKQIQDQHADDPISRQRFLLEAEVTGSLEHPGIVPGSGLTAADAIRGRPSHDGLAQSSRRR
jgi:hypothetical protein